MKKYVVLALTPTLILAAAYGYKVARPAREDVQKRCQTRIQTFVQVLRSNKEVQIMHNAFIGAMLFINRENPAVTPDVVIEAFAQELINKCLAEESTKEEA